MNIVKICNNLLRKYGMEFRKYPNGDLLRMIKLIKHLKIDKIFDIGANNGQYATLMRQLGFDGVIISFEPLSDAFSELKKKTTHDKKWLAVNAAIGNFNGEAFINVAANSQSSSILKMLPSHIKSAPDSVYIKKEKIKIHSLDSIINDYLKPNDRVFLKIDTQGFEKNVLDGAQNSIRFIKGIQMEMSLIPLYEGEVLFFDMVEHMKKIGFSLYSIEGGFSDPESGRLLQIDGIFLK